jgi:HAD superfamily hydrolase (TIGR01459 family)
MTKIIQGLREIAHSYDALLCDAWGVLHNGVELFPGVEEALLEFRQHRGPVLVLTNAPRRGDIIPPQLDRLMLSRDAYDGVVTSGDATRAAIRKFGDAPAFKLGPEKDETLYQGLDTKFAPLEQARFIICTGLFDDLTETPDDYHDLLQQALALELPMICANPDIVVNFGNRMIYCGGAIAALYAKLGGEVIYAGKPHAPIYDLALTKFAAIKPGIDRKRILAIGDGLGTDIRGANQQELDVVFIADGIAAGEFGFDGTISEQAITSLLSEQGVHALASMKGLQW